ncbi:hypothetical protein A2999_00185 [Candidatus Wolfebacteria bacterium RIFCSPLOWO2_01_FULL_38_11]|uniref:Uncharacterized protein n=2 Tax=Candidatus Wolfeibacteriota TaxID=1752735 RepID=A0A0G0J5B2_9BACT|nr:MAG: hypothetical protein US36_C0001G0035 [Candidatus Wolfebacteria bacterium GW2011_GWC1_37_10]OGM90371.1 MAG: hypothetical protein A2999_00185 [Candidatus Wolfebacteria bacterium RIFCSPLOWO2_01_FULL_38_11]
MRFVTFVIMAALVVVSAIMLVNSAVEEDRAECLRLQKQAEEFRLGLFYITPAQKAQCDELKIAVKAPVREGIVR